MFMEKKKCEKEELQASKIQVRVQEKSLIMKNKLIGQYEFSLERTYQMKDHAVMH